MTCERRSSVRELAYDALEQPPHFPADQASYPLA